MPADQFDARTRWKLRRAAEVCLYRVHLRRQAAKAEADQLTARTGRRHRAFRCSACWLWHAKPARTPDQEGNQT
ncbi:hypothetical protein ACIBKY_51155 [Nonomuraea sp. NPDC050394]|uniref:hypothetical protein n=1 Tax=Nonomuraea sp. NPDC050394 TaxID=3364363 RepID=UPI0037A77C38